MPITLLHTDYKILARLIAARLRPILAKLFHPSQYCRVRVNKIFDAVATVRDAIAYAENFGRISHIYLLTVLRSYGLMRDS